MNEECETIIFDYLTNNSVDLKDEDIKEIVNLKCKQFLAILKENQKLKEKLESSEKARKEAVKYLYEHSQYVDEYGIHYIKEDEYCVDYLLDILDIDKGE